MGNIWLHFDRFLSLGGFMAAEEERHVEARLSPQKVEHLRVSEEEAVAGEMEKPIPLPLRGTTHAEQPAERIEDVPRVDDLPADKQHRPRLDEGTTAHALQSTDGLGQELRRVAPNVEHTAHKMQEETRSDDIFAVDTPMRESMGKVHEVLPPKSETGQEELRNAGVLPEVIRTEDAPAIHVQGALPTNTAHDAESEKKTATAMDGWQLMETLPISDTVMDAQLITHEGEECHSAAIHVVDQGGLFELSSNESAQTTGMARTAHARGEETKLRQAAALTDELEVLKRALDAALETALDSVGGTGLEELLNTLVAGVALAADTACTAAAQGTAAAASAAAAREECAVAAHAAKQSHLAAEHAAKRLAQIEAHAPSPGGSPPSAVRPEGRGSREHDSAVRVESDGESDGVEQVEGATPSPGLPRAATLEQYNERLQRARVAKEQPALPTGSPTATLPDAHTPALASSPALASPSPPCDPSMYESFGLWRAPRTAEAAQLLETTVAIGKTMCEGIGREAEAADVTTAAEYYQHGVRANEAESFAAASSWFEASQRLRPRLGTLLSIANMRLKLGDGALAAYLYTFILAHPRSTVAEREMCARKLPLAHVQLEELDVRPAVGTPSGATEQDGARWAEAGGREARAVVAPSPPRLTLEAELAAHADALQAALEEAAAAHRQEVAALTSASREREDALEAMLRELTDTMRSEMGRCTRLQEQHDKEKAALLREKAEGEATVRKLSKQLQQLRAARRGDVEACDEEGQLREALARLPARLSAELRVSSHLAASQGDVLSAAPQLLLGALQLLDELCQQNQQLSDASDAMMAAQADAVRKLAARDAGGGFLASGGFLKGVGTRLGVGAAGGNDASELARKNAEIAGLRRSLQAERREPRTAPLASHSSEMGSEGSEAASVPSPQDGQLPAKRLVPPAAADASVPQSFERMKAELAPLIGELERDGQLPFEDELLLLWQAALSFYQGKESGAVGLLEEHLTWRRKSPYPGIPDIDHIPTSLLARELTCGLLYLNGFDPEGRAVIVFNVNKHTTSSPWYDKKRMLCAAVFVIEQALYESKHPAHQFVLLCNLKGFGMRNFDQYLIGRAFRIIFQNFPSKMHACLLANAPVVFNAAWAILRTWIPADLNGLFHFVEERAIPDFIDMSSVDPAEHTPAVSQARIAPYMGLMVGHLRHARGASSSVHVKSSLQHVSASAPDTRPDTDNSGAVESPAEASGVAPSADVHSAVPGGSRVSAESPTAAAGGNPASSVGLAQEGLTNSSYSAHRPSLPAHTSPPQTASSASPAIRPAAMPPAGSPLHPSAPTAAPSPPSAPAQPKPPPAAKVHDAETRKEPYTRKEAPSSAHSTSTEDARAEASEYVHTLLARANRATIPEKDVKQALSFFEEAKKANSAEDYKAACSYFETSFLLNPKLTTLISTANMHLKLKKPAIASEIYTRLLQNASIPDRERQVALRKLAICETMLSDEAGQDAN